MTALQDWLSFRPVDPIIDMVCRPLRAVLNTDTDIETDQAAAHFTVISPGVERC